MIQVVKTFLIKNKKANNSKLMTMLFFYITSIKILER